eukprot:jgi/Ulvmu1/6003/UM026_0129.1
MAQQAPLSATDNYNPREEDVRALSSAHFTREALGHMPAIRRRVIKLFCPSHPQHENYCLAILHTLHDVLIGLPEEAAEQPLSHLDAANAVLQFEGLPSRGSQNREQQLRKRAKDVLLCCTDCALALLLNVLSLGPPEVLPTAAGGWRGRVHRVAAISAAADFIAAPKPAACAVFAAQLFDSRLCVVALPGDIVPPPLPAAAHGMPWRALDSNPTGDGAEVPPPPADSEHTLTASTRRSTGDTVADAAGPGTRRGTADSFAEATAAAVTLTQLVAAAHAAHAAAQRGDASTVAGAEQRIATAAAAAAAHAAAGEAHAAAAAAGEADAGSASFVMEVLQDAQLVLDGMEPSSQHAHHAHHAAEQPADGPQAQAAVGAAARDAAAAAQHTAPEATGAEAEEGPRKRPRRSRHACAAGEAGTADVGRVGLGGVAPGHAHWTDPETPERRHVSGGSAAVSSRGPSVQATGTPGRSPDSAPRGPPGSERYETHASAERPWEAVQAHEVARGPGWPLQELPRLWRSVEACEERAAAAQLLHKALTGVPGRNKRTRLLMLAEFAGIAGMVAEQDSGGRAEVVQRVSTARQCISTATVQPHIPALAALLAMPGQVQGRAADRAAGANAGVQFAIDYILDFLVSPSALHLCNE